MGGTIRLHYTTNALGVYDRCSSGGLFAIIRAMKQLKLVLTGAFAALAANVVTCVRADGLRPSEPKDVPELLRSTSGATIGSAVDWERIRRPEVLRTLQEKVYGVRPVERPADLRFTVCGEPEDVFGGKAVKKTVRGDYSGPGGSASFEFVAWIPKRAGKVSAFVHISPRPARTANDPSVEPGFWTLPAEYIVSRGYAAIAFCNTDVALDIHGTSTTATGGVFKAFGPLDAKTRQPTEWGILSAWAWGASRVMDWIETEPLLDARRVGVVGLSRNGKTALLAGATDPRFAMTVSCCSGMGGAKLNHMHCGHSETVRLIMKPAWRWFCGAFAEWTDRDTMTPFDQHWLLALVAPRLLYVSSASEDPWAGPRGEFASATLATPVWNLYGKSGLIHHGFPKVNSPLLAGNIGYHLRDGVHDITQYDWQCYLDFADGQGWNL